MMPLRNTCPKTQVLWIGIGLVGVGTPFGGARYSITNRRLENNSVDKKKYNHMKKELKIGETYWIFDGMMNPIQSVLIISYPAEKIGIFRPIGYTAGVPRKFSGAYKTKGDALKKGLYY